MEVAKMAIVPYEPFADLIGLRREMGRFFEDSFLRPAHVSDILRRPGVPAVDIYQTEGDVVVKATIPGVKADDIKIDISGDTLTIKGETKGEEEVQRDDYLYQERHYGSFSRTVALPGGVKADKAEASLEDGVLTLTIPKAEEIKPKTIKVQAKGK